jgi:hypothetical protein
MAKIICALGVGAGIEDLRDSLEEARPGSCAGFAQQALELGEELLDGIEVCE